MTDDPLDFGELDEPDLLRVYVVSMLERGTARPVYGGVYATRQAAERSIRSGGDLRWLVIEMVLGTDDVYVPTEVTRAQ